ncbi:MAG: hypothetical protein GY804_09465 [Alphaproteobacteria bacterium]|nr:hypothetical protein [Alphaproteobacteria bacterium]
MENQTETTEDNKLMILRDPFCRYMVDQLGPCADKNIIMYGICSTAKQDKRTYTKYKDIITLAAEIPVSFTLHEVLNPNQTNVDKVGISTAIESAAIYTVLNYLYYLAGPKKSSKIPDPRGMMSSLPPWQNDKVTSDWINMAINTISAIRYRRYPQLTDEEKKVSMTSIYNFGSISMVNVPGEFGSNVLILSAAGTIINTIRGHRIDNIGNICPTSVDIKPVTVYINDEPLLGDTIIDDSAPDIDIRYVSSD